MTHKIFNSVSLQRGLGYAGRRITIEEIECEMCGYDRMIREERVYPEEPSDVNWHCRFPNCPDHKSATEIIPRL